MAIAIMCSGGDASGMNPALKRFVEYSKEKHEMPYFIYNGLEGLIDNQIKEANYSDVSGIITKGGTIIGSSRSQRFFEKSYRQQAFNNLQALGIDKLIVLGGDGSFRAMHAFTNEFELNTCGIPTTIDNDICGTHYCLGVDTALNTIRDAIDKVRDTASSFARAFVIETMGRDCGYLALASALTCGAEMCLVPEVAYNLDSLEVKFKQQIKEGRDYFIAIVAEGCDCTKEIETWFNERIGFDTRITTLGHIQRGGNPSVYDRLMAYKFATFAVDKVLEGNASDIVVYNQEHFNYVKINEVATVCNKIENELMEFAKKLCN